MQTNVTHTVTERQLSNGGKLLHIVVPHLPISVVSVWLQAGSRFDFANKEGLAHFFEHVYMQNTKKFPRYDQRLQVMESLGIKQNAFTSFESAHYYHFQPVDKTFASLDFLLDGLHNSIITGKKVEKEKNIIIDEQARNSANPESYIWRLSSQALWPNSTIGRDFFGNSKTINNITLQDIIRFKKIFYQPHNSVFVIISPHKTSEIFNYLVRKQAKNTTASLVDDMLWQKHQQCGEPNLVTLDKRNIEQVYVAVNFKTCPMHNYQEVLVLDLIKEYLANTWISVLNRELRLKRNSTYWVYGDTENFSDTGYIRVTFSTQKEKLNQALEVAFIEIEALKKKRIQPNILKNYITAYSASLLTQSLQPNSLLLWYGWPQVTGGMNESVSSYIKRLSRVTPDEIQAVAQKYLTHNNAACIFIGNITEKEIHNSWYNTILKKQSKKK
ncbi:MAG TPA: pitrilysin family protein [Patescibacteria group bacterium]|nr:pitrilysin family protein [Patescibacteria group bacterium]